MNRLYGWKGRVHKAIKVFEQSKVEYVRVCALPKTTNDVMKTANRTTTNHDADIALTWVLLESSRKIVDATCDGYMAAIKSSFDDYRRIQAEKAQSQQTTATATPAPGANANNDEADPTVTIWIEGVVENTINSHVKFIEQWREIISDAQKEASAWKSGHEKYLSKMCEVEEAQRRFEDPDYSDDDDDDDDDSVDSKDDSEDEYEKSDDDEDDDEDDIDDDDDSVNEYGDDQLELLRKGMKVDEQADRLFKMGTYISAGKVLIASLKIASKIESIEAAAQEAGTACILGLTQANLRDRDVTLGNMNHTLAPGGNGADDETSSSDCSKLESDIAEEWKQETDTTKLNAIYSWYRLYHGALPCINMEQL